VKQLLGCSFGSVAGNSAHIERCKDPRAKSASMVNHHESLNQFMAHIYAEKPVYDLV
jgi:hypothetical protein